MEPGMANTSRPCSSACRAVIREPLCRAANNETASAHAADNAVAAREIPTDRRRAQWKLGNERSLFGQFMRKLAIACWIDEIQSRSYHCDAGGRTAQTAAMSCCVYAKRHPAHNAKPGIACRFCKRFSVDEALRRCIA